MQDLVRQLLQALGEDPDREGLLSTPRRVAQSFEFLTSGYHANLDEIVNDAKNLVGEAEAMSTEPDRPIAAMAAELGAGTRRLDQALRAFVAGDREAATATADRAVKEQRHLQHTYRDAMSELVKNENFGEVTAKRELYRRLARAGDELVLVAERVWYAVLKER